MMSWPQVQASVNNFTLLDHLGRSHELYYYEKDKETKLLVLYVQGNGCKIVKRQIPKLKTIKEKYEGKGVRFWMINSNPDDSRAAVVKEAKKRKLTWPILLDDAQLVARTLDLKHTAEVLVINPRNWDLIYRGTAVKGHLEQALDAGLKGESPARSRTEATGTPIKFEKVGDDDGVSYSKTIAPLLLKNCVTCHQAGGIGPFVISSYKKARGWSQMIREVVLTGRMPPWHADPHHSTFKNAFGLTTKEKQQLVSWIDAGSPKDEGEDVLAAHIPNVEEWPHGKPDLIINLPVQEVPAEGVMPYLYSTHELPFTEDTWLSATHLKPGNTKVLHHVINYLVKGSNRRPVGSAGGYAPGTGAEPVPEGYGILVPAGSSIRFEIHYTTTGKVETDASRLALYIHKTKPAKRMFPGATWNYMFRIPPYERDHKSKDTHRLQWDVDLFQMYPHMHYRGKSMKYTAVYPDGKEEVLLSVPAYDFNWQRNYILDSPKRLPKGTRIVVTNSWDNSVLNPYNPDPKKSVRFGEQTWDEMGIGFFSYGLAD